MSKYGSWKSPITSNTIASGTIELGKIILDDNDIYWLETRPTEGGRNVIVRRSPNGQITDITPESYNVKSRVHESGGGDFAVINGTVYFSNKSDQRLYRQTPGNQPQPITSQENLRYADIIIDSHRNRIIGVREDHRLKSIEAHGEAINTIVSLDLESNEGGQVLVSGDDFYQSPRLSPDGSRLAWIAWNHPNMPWDKTELWIAEINADGTLGQKQLVINGVSVFQPEWSPDGILYFVSEQTGWWNLYDWRDHSVEPLCNMSAEFGRPGLSFGRSFYAFTSVNHIICTYCQQGEWQVASVDTATHQLELIQTSYTEFKFIQATTERTVFCAGSPIEPWSIVQLDLSTGKLEVLRRSSELSIDIGYFSEPEPIEFPTEQKLTAHAFFYAAKNQEYLDLSDEKPPLIVKVHGGPISSTSTVCDLEIQYWTSRGFAVVDVNYGGSMGYGREYRERLKGKWGIVDVDDCLNVVQYLVKNGKVDGDRLAITGGSAGGYTTLSCLTFRDIFKAGACYYGIGNLETLPNDTDKPESRYLDGLVAESERWERSPINFTERLSSPVIFFHGLEDVVVQPRQTELMVKALLAKKLPVAYIFFVDESHGFKREGNIKRVIDTELYFYSRIFGFDFIEKIEPVLIENL